MQKYLTLLVVLFTVIPAVAEPADPTLLQSWVEIFDCQSPSSSDLHFFIQGDRLKAFLSQPEGTVSQEAILLFSVLPNKIVNQVQTRSATLTRGKSLGAGFAGADGTLTIAWPYRTVTVDSVTHEGTNGKVTWPCRGGFEIPGEAAAEPAHQ